MTDIVDEPIKIDNPQDQKGAVKIAILADESGSMLYTAAQTIENLNKYIDEQAQKDEPTFVSVYTFNGKHDVRDRYTNRDAKQAPRLIFPRTADADEKLVYAPDGGTPLYDAIGTVISKEASNTPTLVVILTDGEENASKEYRTKAAIQALMKTWEDRGWTFIFLMAGLTVKESVAYTSNLMGRDYAGATMTYAKGLEDVAFRGLASSTESWMGSARLASATGATLNAQNMTESFFDPSMRNIQQAEVKNTEKKDVTKKSK